MYVLADSRTGYCLDMELDDRQKYDEEPAYSTVGLTMTMLRRSDYLGQGYFLTTDNYYSSLRLLKRLLAENTYFLGKTHKLTFLAMDNSFTTILQVP